jgi:hypothetical protein
MCLIRHAHAKFNSFMLISKLLYSSLWIIETSVVDRHRYFHHIPCSSPDVQNAARSVDGAVSNAMVWSLVSKSNRTSAMLCDLLHMHYPSMRVLSGSSSTLVLPRISHKVICRLVNYVAMPSRLKPMVPLSTGSHVPCDAFITHEDPIVCRSRCRCR